MFKRFKGSVKKILSGSRAYLQLRYSPLWLAALRWVRPLAVRELEKQEEYFMALLQGVKPGGFMAFDIGANEGFVTETLLKKGLRVIAVEPDPRSIRVLKARFSRDGRFFLYPEAAGEREGKAELFLEAGGGALSTVSLKWKGLVEGGGYRLRSGYGQAGRQVGVIALDSLIAAHGLPCFVKIDVEGYEVQVLKGLTQKVPLVVFEANLPEFLAETLECCNRLYTIDKEALFNYSSDFILRLESGVPFTVFRDLLPTLKERCIDIICTMSNFGEYYEPAIRS